jgi:hypothetical protein
MASIALEQDLTTTRTSSRRFFVWMAVLCLAMALVGFAPTYWVPVSKGTFVGPPIAHIHGLLFTAWTIFFVVQAWLIASGRTQRHRALGLVGISLVTAMVIVGLLVAIDSTLHGIALGFRDRAIQFMTVPVTGIILFAGLIVAAIANVRNEDVHKRLMLVATASLLQAAVGRWFRMLLAPPDVLALPVADSPHPPVMFTIGPGLVSDIPIIIAIIYDWRTRGRPHPAYLIGGGIVLFTQLARIPLSTTAAWRSIAEGLLALAR